MSIKPNEIFIRNIKTQSVRLQTNRLGLIGDSSGLNNYLIARGDRPMSELQIQKTQNVPRFPNSITQFSFGQANVWMKAESKLRIPYPIPGNASDPKRSQQRVAVGKNIVKREMRAMGNRLY